MLPVEAAFKVFTDLNGDPLDNGYVYFGIANLNPVTSPVTVYWDTAGTQPAAQPLRTVNGYIVRAGTPANVFISGGYSELVNDSTGSLVFYAKNSSDFSIASNLASPSGAASIGFSDTLSPTYIKTVSDVLNGLDVSIYRFIDSSKHASIRAMTNTDDLISSFTTAMLSGAKKIVVPYGKFNVSDRIVVSQNGFKFIGDGPSASIIVSTVNNKSVIAVSPSLTGVEIAGFMLDRIPSAVVGGSGLDWSQTGSQLHVRDMLIQNQYEGVILGGTDYSTAERLIVQNCFSHGILLTNGPLNGNLQWSLIKCISSNNNGDGYRVQSTPIAGGITMGTWSNVATFANSGYGASFLASAGSPLNGIRLTGDCFFGSDGNSELFLDTYGNFHTINASFLEGPGTSANGRFGLNPITNIGSGIEISANNFDVDLHSLRINGCSQDGIVSSASTVTNINNVTTTNNGLAAIPFRRNGINIFGAVGRANIIGCRSNGNFFGIAFADGAKTNVSSCDLNGNSSGPITGGINPTQIQQIANTPTFIATILPQTSVTIGLPAGAAFAGGINVSNNISLNGVVYANP